MHLKIINFTLRSVVNFNSGKVTRFDLILSEGEQVEDRSDMLGNVFNMADMAAILSRSVRSTYAKFRLSNHQLMIEKGRYLGLPPENRLCPFGCNKVEDEFHFFAKCSFNSDIRSKFTNEIFDANHSCLSLPDFHKCISSADESVVLRSALYVRDSFVTRKNALQK